MSASRRTASLVGLVAILGLSAGCGSSGSSTTSLPTSAAPDPVEVTTTTCEDIAEDSVRISGESNSDVKLIKVRAIKVKTDNRKTVVKPTSGGGDSLVLACTGTGVWSDASTTPVLLKMTVDADGELFVSYEET